MSSVAFDTTAFQRPQYDRGTLQQRQFARHRVRVEPDRSEWNAVLGDRFNHLCSLELGWDGYRGLPVSFACARFAAAILEHLYKSDLPPPSLVPGSDGTLQIEWHLNGFDIELDILAPNKVSAYRFDHHSGNEDEREISNDFTVVDIWLREITARPRALDLVG